MRPAAVTVLLGVALIFTAAIFDAEPLYVPGAALVVLASGAVAWVQAGSRGVRVARTIPTQPVVEEQAVAIEIVVAAGRLGLPTGWVEDPLLPAPAPLAAGRRVTRVHIHARFDRRGLRRVAAPRVVVRDPFGLATRVARGVADVDVLVLPRIEPVVVAPGAEEAATLASRRGRSSIAVEVDLDGLRPYRTGSPASRIYWPALARSGELVERRLQADSDTRPLVVLDPRGAPTQDDLDAAVRAATSLCVALARAGGCALLLPGDRSATVFDPGLAGWEHAHARLAVVDGRGGPNLGGMASRRGPVFYVAALAPGGGVQRGLAHAPGRGRVLVVPGTLPARRAAFTVAGCSGYELGARRPAAVA